MSPVRYCGGTPNRTVQNQVFCRTGRPRRTVRYRKRPCGVRELILTPGPHAAVAAAQVVVQNGRRAQAEAGGDSSGAGVAEVREGEVAAEQM